MSKSEQRRAERRERELAKLAAKGAKASGVQVASASPATQQTLPLPPMTAPAPRPVSSSPVSLPPVTPPVQTAALGQRVGQRIGPVDPARLPEELRPASSGVPAAPPPKLVVVSGATQLPPPDAARPKLEPFSPPAPAPVRVASVEPKLSTAPVTTLPPLAPKPVMPPLEVKPAPVTPPPLTPAAVQPPPAVQLATPSTLANVEPKQASAAQVGVAVAAKPDPLAPVVPAPLATEPKPTQVAMVDVKPAMPSVTAPPPVTTTPPVSPAMAVSEPGNSVLVPSQPLVKPVDLPPSAPQGALTSTGVPAPVTLPTATVPAPLTPPPAAEANPRSETPAAAQFVGPPASLANPAPVVTAGASVQATEIPPQPGFAADGPPAPALEPERPAPEKPAPGARLASILDGIEQEAESAAAPLPSIAEIRAQKLAAQRKADAEAKAKLDKENTAKLAKEEAAKKAEEEAAKIKANPGRIWVQLATGANRSGLPITFRKLKGDAPKALGDRQGWFVPFRSTYRLLVGPMKGPGDARQLVTALSKEGVSATTYGSEPGQEVTRLGGK